MSYKFSKSSLSAVLVLLVSTLSPGQVIFEDDFESFLPGQQLVCQDSVNWDTWSSIPCDPTEDPLISDNISFSGMNSVWIQQNNDLIKPIPDYTIGKYSISFYLYVPEGYTAGWLQEAEFNAGSYVVGFYARFDTAGNGNINAGGFWSAVFGYEYNTWIHNELIIDLDNDWAEFYLQDNLIYSWQWTLGADSTGCPRQISVTDIWGGIYPNTGPSQWYMDDYLLERLDPAVGIKGYSSINEFQLEQNYPNPFNPVTYIEYQIIKRCPITIKVYDVLGNVVGLLVNEEKEAGRYSIEFDASGLPSGVYIYQLKADGYVAIKKKILLK